MKIDPGIELEKTEVINKLIEELYCFFDELEQKVRKDLYHLKPGIEADATPTREDETFSKKD